MGLTIEYSSSPIEVYDITVKDNHNFFANDILIHNCQEILLPTAPIKSVDDTQGQVATCILSALNVGTIKDHEYERICDLAVRGLDEIIDYQNYPIPAAEKYTKNQRTLGIGIINYAYALAKHKLKWESEPAYRFTHQMMENIQFNLIKASVNLSKEKGPAPEFSTSKYADGFLPIHTYKKEIDQVVDGGFDYVHDWEWLKQEVLAHGMRNCSLTAIAPTESSSITSGSTSGIDPIREFLTIRRSKKGDLKTLAPEYQKYKNYYEPLWSMKSMKGYLTNMAIMQKFADQSISSNTSYNPLNYKNNTVGLETLVEDLFLSYSLGLKTLYYNNTYDMNSNDQVDEDDSCASGACKI